MEALKEWVTSDACHSELAACTDCGGAGYFTYRLHTHHSQSVDGRWHTVERPVRVRCGLCDGLGLIPVGHTWGDVYRKHFLADPVDPIPREKTIPDHPRVDTKHPIPPTSCRVIEGAEMGEGEK